MTIDIDSDVAFYDVELSEEMDLFFIEIVQKHKELVDNAPEGDDWIYQIGNGALLSDHLLQPESAEAVLDVITDVYKTGALDDDRYVELMESLEFVARDDDRVPDALLD